jgi:hypothetical protein
VWIFAYFEFFNPQSAVVLGALLILPILINAVVFYFIGALIEWGLKGIRQS